MNAAICGFKRLRKFKAHGIPLFRSIKGQLVVWNVLLLLVLGCLFWWLYRTVEEVVLARERQHLHTLAMCQGTHLIKLLRTFDTLTHKPWNFQIPKDSLRLKLYENLVLLPKAQSLSLLDPHGKVIASSEASLEGKVPFDPKFLEELRESPYTAELAFSEETGISLLSAVRPSGFLCLTYTTEALLSPSLRGSELRVYLVDPYGLRIPLSRAPEGAGKVLEETYRLPMGWSVAIVAPLKTVLHSVRMLISWAIILCFAFEGIIVLLIVFLIPRRYAGPLQRLANLAGQIASGDLSVRAGYTRRQDEIGRLFRDFDEMAEALQARTDSLQESLKQERQLRQELQVLANVVHYTGDYVIITDQNARILYVNPAFEQGVGYSKDEVIGKTPAVLKSGKTPLEVYKDMWDTILKGETWRGELYNRKKDGGLYVAAITISPVLDEEGEITGFVGIQRDITYQKELEEEIRRYLESLERIVEDRTREVRVLAQFPEVNPNPVLRCDPSGRVLYMNPAARQTFLRSAEDTLYLQELLPEYADEILKAFQNGQPIIGREVSFGDRTFLLSAVPFAEAESIFVGLQDVTELRKIQERLQALVRELDLQRRRAEDASRAKSMFLANMSHELRTPLNAILGFGQLLRADAAGPLNDRQRRYVDHILESGQHLLDIINDILDLSRVEAGKVEMRIEPVSLEELVRQGLSMVQMKARNHNISLSMEVEKGLEKVPADPRMFKQILFNLLSNAVKFTPDGGKVLVTAKRVKADELPKRPETEGLEGEWVMVSVSDTGIGIAPEDQERIWREFEQVDSDLSRRYEGTGLGLPLTKRLVELHGGRIWVESEPGKGSTFTFVLPLNREGGTQAVEIL
ncbi:MAG: hypothetical protein DRP95_01840 [Candidatus Latescibacterota bacterium]|nr:MAG: hypothetical protein DRP95_01840 [Candidatus Latescibacterota bacterium]